MQQQYATADNPTATHGAIDATELIGFVWDQNGVLIRTGWTPEAAQTPADWTPDLVRERLVEAIRWLHRSVGRVGPKSYGNAMPAYIPEWGDLLAQADAGNLYDGGNRIRLQASAQQVTGFEQALQWPVRFVSDLEWRSAVMLDLASKALRVPLTRLCKRRGLALATVKRHRSRGLTLIAQGLCSEGVMP